ncbi:2OG-Fe(II) oxygenase [Chitinophaga nivalis]|uniref:2OG-Fe(II) oxygenase n=1 Tax=Chitinophaga nivalis TaxID=2991709 RepID=A0ABT3IPB4_9BACT|nr:2OG-Fe(II) oxygenase [Chitinophaga nivalis]MCW3464500.1 2OG-Fe(II) oxygenase [Chitinophaga nivalis]MCW3485809.1 2OG-Fe(II) oxygenase [Chitinophaga nivalis]
MKTTTATIRTETVAGKNIYIIDDVFTPDEIDAFYDFVVSLPVRRAEKDTSYDEFPIYTTEFDPAKFETDSFIGQKAREIFFDLINEPETYTLWRSYTNLSNYGDVAYPHRDCAIDRNDMTVLYYVNKDWHYKYGGETIFYDEKDSRVSVLPKPGRFVIFPGSIEHKGSVSSRICKETRITLALKYVVFNGSTSPYA